MLTEKLCSTNTTFSYLNTKKTHPRSNEKQHSSIVCQKRKILISDNPSAFNANHLKFIGRFEIEKQNIAGGKNVQILYSYGHFRGFVHLWFHKKILNQ